MSVVIPADWSFKRDEIAEGFDEHVRGQLPWYDLATSALVHVARHYIPDNGLVYDIGASTGNIGRALADTLKARSASLFALDESAEMVARYRGPGLALHAEACSFAFARFDLAVLFLVVMFMPVEKRRSLLDKLLATVRPGGAIILFDKQEGAGGYPGTILHRLTLAGKVSAGVEPRDILDKEFSLAGIQRPVVPSLLDGLDAVEFFRFGDFAGWLIEAP